MDEPERGYALGTSAEEIDRLGLQHHAWCAVSRDLWDRAGLAPGQTILDIGSGPGYATLELAQLVGSTGHVIAVDLSKRFLDHLERALRLNDTANVTLLERDAQELDLPESSLDGAWSRWVLSFVPEPARVVAAVARALRPGGAFALQEYMSYDATRLAPPSAPFERAIRAVVQSWRRRGGDPDIGCRLPGLLQEHGLAVKELRAVAQIARPGALLWQSSEAFFRSYLPSLVSTGLLTKDDQRALGLDWQARSRDPSSFFLSSVTIEVIAEKSAS
jgi:SAM-dependent methyltransferase